VKISQSTRADEPSFNQLFCTMLNHSHINLNSLEPGPYCFEIALEVENIGTAVATMHAIIKKMASSAALSDADAEVESILEFIEADGM